jgi:hypothetical protein
MNFTFSTSLTVINAIADFRRRNGVAPVVHVSDVELYDGIEKVFVNLNAPAGIAFDAFSVFNETGEIVGDTTEQHDFHARLAAETDPAEKAWLIRMRQWAGAPA